MKCEECGKKLTKRWLEKTDGEELCRDCYTQQTNCDECGKKIAVKASVTIKGKTHCRECMLKDEEPIQVTLVRSSWAPWGEHPVIPIGDLLYRELSGKKSRRKPSTPMLIGLELEPELPLCPAGGIK